MPGANVAQFEITGRDIVSWRWDSLLTNTPEALPPCLPSNPVMIQKQYHYMGNQPVRFEILEILGEEQHVVRVGNKRNVQERVRWVHGDHRCLLFLYFECLFI